MEFNHYTVMKDEAIDFLNINPNGVYVDATLGGGGHSLEIVSRLSDKGRLIAIDRDSEAICFAKNRLKSYESKIHYVKDNYANMSEAVKNFGYEKADGILMDLGVSSYQIDAVHRGFSYMKDTPLDMRMDKEQTLTAETVLNEFDKNKLKDILYKYGEERYTELIVRELIKSRKLKPIKTTAEFAGIIKSALRHIKYNGGHFAKRSFQAVRIYVNDELEKIEPSISAAVELLNPNGRLVILSFNSLEDRVVKQCFNRYAKGCECPPDFPVCACGKEPLLEVLTRKPVYPSDKELAENSRSESAKLRASKKLQY